MDENKFQRIYAYLDFIDHLRRLTEANGRYDLDLTKRLNKALDAVEKLLEDE